METKPRILYLQKILLERTDEENPLSTTQLINILNDEYGISAHRTTVTKDIAALQEFGMDIVTMPDDFDIENYTKEVFFMFPGEKVLVDLRCDNSLMKTMVDRFGEDVTTLAYDMTSFRVQTEVSASPTFFGWVFGFNGKVQILAPGSVKEQYRQMIAKADENM